MSIFSKLFGKQEVDDNSERPAEDDYTIRKSRRADIIIGIISLLCAILVWVVAVSQGASVQ